MGLSKYTLYRMFMTMTQFFDSNDEDLDSCCVDEFSRLYSKLDELDRPGQAISLEQLYAHVRRQPASLCSAAHAKSDWRAA